MELRDVFISKAEKYNCYQECQGTEGRRCIDCTRWRLSFPYSCVDYDMCSAKGETCINWTNECSPPVD